MVSKGEKQYNWDVYRTDEIRSLGSGKHHKESGESQFGYIHSVDERK